MTEINARNFFLSNLIFFLYINKMILILKVCNLKCFTNIFNIINA